MMLKSAIYDTIELGKDKIRKDRDENQTPCDDYARPLEWTLSSINCDRTCSAGINKIFTRDMNQFGRVFANLLRIKELYKVVSEFEKSSVSVQSNLYQEDLY